MPIPSQTLTIRDPGLGLAELSDNVFLFFGCASSGSTSEVKGFSSAAAVVAEYGQGPLPEALCHALAVAGGPVYGCRMAGSTAGAAGSVTKTAAGSSTGTITVAGAAYDRYSAIVQITKTGTVGTGEFRYSLDGGRTYSESLVIPSGATYVLPNTNLTLTFVPGAGAVFFQVGDSHAFTSTAPHYSTTELAAGITALQAFLSITPEFLLDALVLVGRFATGSASATMWGALSTHLSALFNQYRYLRAIMDMGSGDSRANAKTAYASLADARIAVVYGDVDLPSSKPFVGFGAPTTSLLVSAAARAARELISTDLARVASGPLTGVLKISNDEFANQDMDSAKATVSTTMPLAQGFFLTNMRLKSPTGSDYLYWQHGRIMDVACRVTAKAQQQFLNSGFGTNPDGTIEESEAKRIEAVVSEALKVALIDPKNVEGKPGHVSDFKYTVDRTNNLLVSSTLMSKVAIRPFGYAKSIVTELGMSANVNG